MAKPKPTSDQRVEALALFNSKWQTVRKIVDFRAHHRGIRRDDRGDLQQDAGEHLWQSCLRAVDPERGGFKIQCRLAANYAFEKRARSQRRFPLREADLLLPDADDDAPSPLDAPVPRPGARVLVDGMLIDMTEVDVRLDSPELIELYDHGISMARRARADGVTRQALSCRCKAGKSDGAFFCGLGRRGRWLFPLLEARRSA